VSAASTRGRPEISTAFIESICERIDAGQRVRRSLPGWGRIFVDRQLPYLVVYRQPADRGDAGTDRLATGSAVYLTASWQRQNRSGLKALTREVCRSLATAYGAVLLVELWTRPHSDDEEQALHGIGPAFRVAVSRRDAAVSYADRLQAELGKLTIHKQRSQVSLVTGVSPAPLGMRPLLTRKEADAIGCHLVGIEIGPVHQEPGGNNEFPAVRRELQRKLGRALALTFFDFALTQTPHRPRSYHALGRRALVNAVWKVDEQLAEVGASFDLLMLVTPTNTEQVWSAFRRKGYEGTPDFRYRPLTIDTSLIKRRLHSIRIESAEDPTIAQLFHNQRQQLDRQLSLLAGRETPTFLHDGLALYGDVNEDLSKLAHSILAQVPPTADRGGRSQRMDAAEFASRASAELDHYRLAHPELGSSVELRDDVSSLMVSRGNLFVGSRMTFPAARVEALLNHEIGTHVVTYVNGSQQPLRLLASGLAGYEALQEGLGVFAEFLTGGLSPARMRTLAARVISARWLTDGASFVETFRQLDSGYGFDKRSAFWVTMRVYRGGGFVKDAIYLRGLRSLLEYLGTGGKLSTLITGKVALTHTAVIEELLRRGVLKPPLLQPRYLESEAAKDRLERVRQGMTIDQLIGGFAE
jgi:uncharacterized protein (TIGR02421 family)